MIFTITIVAAILLVLILLFGHKKPKNKIEKKSVSWEETPDFVGQSHFKLRHKMSTDDTTEKADCQVEKDNTFVSSEVFEEDNQALDIDFPLEMEKEFTEDDLAEEEEEIESLFGQDAVLASGVEFDDLFKTKQVIENTNSTLKEEQEAGKVLYKNQNAVLFEELVSKQKSTGIRISSLVDIHLSKLNDNNEEENKTETTDSISDEYKSFNINDFTNN